MITKGHGYVKVMVLYIYKGYVAWLKPYIKSQMYHPLITAIGLSLMALRLIPAAWPGREQIYNVYTVTLQLMPAE
jgi:hypothetical protein